MSITDDKIHAALVAFDKDADGLVFPNEVTLSQLSLGVYLQRDQRQEFNAQLSDRPINYENAKALIQRVSRGRQPLEELEKMFASFDVKNDGTISAAELKAVLIFFLETQHAAFKKRTSTTHTHMRAFLFFPLSMCF